MDARSITTRHAAPLRTGAQGIDPFARRRLLVALFLCVLAGCRTEPRAEPQRLIDGAMGTASPLSGPTPVHADPARRSHSPAATETPSVALAAFSELTSELPASERLVAPARTETEEEITLAELQQLALANNPTLVMAANQVAKEEGNWLQAGLWPNPVAGYLRSDPDAAAQSHTSGAFVQQTFVTAGKLRLAREQEEFGIQDAVQGLTAQRQRVLNDVETRYIEALGAQHLLAVAIKMERIASEAANLIQRAVRDGEADPIDAVRAEMQYKRMQLAVRSARAQVASTWQHLMDMTGTPTMPLRRLAGDLEEETPPLNAEEQWQRLVTASPLLAQLWAQLGVARKAWELAVARRIPDVTGQVVVERDSTQDFTTVQTLVAVPVPVFNRNQGAIQSAWHEIRRAQAEIERTRLALRDAFEASFRWYTDAFDRVQTLRRDLLPAARKALALTLKAQQAGERSLSDVLDTRQAYFDTELEYASALVDLRLAEAELRGMQLTGGLNPTEIGTAIQSSGGTSAQRRALQQLLEQRRRGRLQPFTPGTTGQ